jgi:hypothetical protein
MEENKGREGQERPPGLTSEASMNRVVLRNEDFHNLFP